MNKRGRGRGRKEPESCELSNIRNEAFVFTTVNKTDSVFKVFLLFFFFGLNFIFLNFFLFLNFTQLY